MTHKVILRPKVEKELQGVNEKYKKRIITAFVNLGEDPYTGKKLEGEYKGYYSLRVLPFRIIYKVYKKRLVVLVIRIGHRQGVYK